MAAWWGEYVDANGKRRYISGKTKTEVRQKLRKVLADRDEGIAYDSENPTVGVYLHRWLEAIHGSVRERTWERHEQVVRLHLEPTIGGLKLDRLTTAKQRISEGAFPSQAGTSLCVHNVRNRSWKPLLERARLPVSTRMHDLRHTCATLMPSEGVPVKVVSDMLGHASVAITLDTYGHVLPNMQEAAAKAMDDALI